MTTNDDLREVLRDRAKDIRPHDGIPRSVLRRAHRRIARNATVAAAALLLAGAGAVVGIRAFDAPERSAPAGLPISKQHTSPNPSRAPSPSTSTLVGSAMPRCTSAQLRAVGSLQGAAGSQEGEIVVRNLSDSACRLKGRPTVTLLDQDLTAISSGVEFSSSPPGWKADASPAPPGWPLVTVFRKDVATIRIRWSNWCPQGRAAPLWRVAIPGRGTIDVMGLDAASPPPCNGAGSNSTIEVGPFEPGRS